MFFLTPKYLKQGRLYVKEAEKRLAYHRDRWSPETIQLFEQAKAALKTGVADRNKEKIDAAAEDLEKLCAKHCPVGRDAWIGENVEVFLVAIIVALGIRTFFIQPFTIPTASMQPTLFGITGVVTNEPKPNILSRAAEFAWAGRTYHEVVAEQDETITNLEEVKWMVVFTYTKITTDKKEYWVNEMLKPMTEPPFNLQRHRSYKKGETIVRGFTDTGDHVFVDKISYHFRKPRPGEVFVFDTRTIPTQGGTVGTTQYYIKRLAAAGPVELRLDAPNLFINGEKAQGFGYERVMSGTEKNPVAGYHGYGNMPRMHFLRTPDETFTVGNRQYFAMGDNSYNSSDSRDWGVVPEKNLMGSGVFVYWPFGRARQTGTSLEREGVPGTPIPGGRWGIIK